MRKHLFVTALISLAAAIASSATAQSVIPRPVKMETGTKAPSITLTAGSSILYNQAGLKETAEIFGQQIEAITGYKLSVKQSERPRPNSIFLEQVSDLGFEAKLQNQAYTLDTLGKYAHIRATAPAGIFYGTVSFAQLLPVPTETNPVNEWTVAPVMIEDAPQFPWRGVMLDVARYFFNKDYVLRYLDMMAMHKMNVFHWHLIDDCGWRIEIKKYPKLTEIGGQRGEGRYFHQGYYTQEEIKEIVAYAAARNISVVPEIEVPAHTQSALAAYPHLGCFNRQFTVPDRHSISPEIYCAGRESTYDFLEDVMDEVAALFPAPFIHIGGDEAKYARWKECPECQKRIQDSGLKDEKALQGWMTDRIAKYVKSKHNKTLIGWAEVLEAGVSPETGIMAWHRPHHVAEGAKNGHIVVNSLTRHTYFDTPESKLPGEPPCATWTPPVSLEKAYDWHPVPDGLTESEAANILGPNACVWTDRFLHNRDVLHDRPGEGTTRSWDYLDYLSLPRFAALAEVGWTPRELRDYADFTERMKVQYRRYQNRDYNFRVPTPLLTTKRDAKRNLIASAESPVAGATVHYTTDGSEPTGSSPLFDSELTLDRKAELKVATFISDDFHSLTYTHIDESNKFAKWGEVFGEWKAGKVAARTPREERFDATGLIDSNGTYEITFIYTGGSIGLQIEGVRVFRNDTVLMGEDIHSGFTGGGSRNNTYRIKIDGYETGASFIVKAQMCGDTGDNSNGVVCIKKVEE